MHVFVSYSHRDSAWVERVRVHLKPISRRLNVDVWDDTRIGVGVKWRKEIAKAIDVADVAILMISADFPASEFVSTNELPPLLKSAEEDGILILPLIVAPSLFSYYPELAQFQAVNDPSEPLISLDRSKQEAIFLKVAEAVFRHATDIDCGAKKSRVSSLAYARAIRQESFLNQAQWTRLIKVGDWVYDQTDLHIVGGSMHSYLLSRDEYGEVPFTLQAELRFSALLGGRANAELINPNAGIVFGWNSDGQNPRYFNLLMTGRRMLLEKIGFNGGDAYRDYEHMDEGVEFELSSHSLYKLHMTFGSRSIEVSVNGQQLYSIKRPARISGRVGIRPWRSQVHCSAFLVGDD